MPDTLTLDVLVDGTRAAEKLGTDGFEITLQGGGYNAPENAGTGFVHAVLQVCLVPHLSPLDMQTLLPSSASCLTMKPTHLTRRSNTWTCSVSKQAS